MNKIKCQIIRIDEDDIGYRVNVFDSSTGEEYYILAMPEQVDSALQVGNYILFDTDLVTWELLPNSGWGL